MSRCLRVLGIDLASKSWADSGTAILTFQDLPEPEWVGADYGCISWPNVSLTADGMAETIHTFAVQNGIHAISLDGPQGWREPNAGNRKGVGRWCEYLARCQGKTGVYGTTYPYTQYNWIQFCIDVFNELMKKDGVKLANNTDVTKLEPFGEQGYWLLECFPTSIWKNSRLKPLPGKAKVGNDRQLISSYARTLTQSYGLPALDNWQGTHDDLQAIVAALPAAGLLGGPCRSVPKGKPGWNVGGIESAPSHWVEGIIWDSEPLVSVPMSSTKMAEDTEGEIVLCEEETSNNEFLIDERDDSVTSRIQEGIRIFLLLADMANNGMSIGIGYAQFACMVHGVDEFKEIAGRDYAQSDTPKIIALAHQITETSGGRMQVSKNGVVIKAGMDTFIWPLKPPHRRSSRAFTDTPYTEDDWNVVFPDGARRLLKRSEL